VLVLVDVLVDVDVEVLVEVVVAGAVVVVEVVGPQHSYADITTHFPTLGIFLLRIRLPATSLPCPSSLAKPNSGLLSIVPMILKKLIYE
jgi:hypothetical protein